jgi:hypothetical protein
MKFVARSGPSVQQRICYLNICRFHLFKPPVQKLGTASSKDDINCTDLEKKKMQGAQMQVCRGWINGSEAVKIR